MASKKLISLAYKARKRIEEFSLANPEVSVSRDLVELAGYCAIASAILCKMAETKNIKLKLVQGFFRKTPADFRAKKPYINHCWTITNNHIIDITATQFGIRDKVYVVDIRESMYYLPIEQTMDFSKWPKEQDPNTYNSFLNNIK